MIQAPHHPKRLIHLFRVHHGVLPNANRWSVGHRANDAGSRLITATDTATNNNKSPEVQITTHNKLNSRKTEEILSCILIYTALFITQVPWGLYKLRHQYRLVSAMPQWSDQLKSTYHVKCDENTGKTAERVIEKNSQSGKHASILCFIPNGIYALASGLRSIKSYVKAQSQERKYRKHSQRAWVRQESHEVRYIGLICKAEVAINTPNRPRQNHWDGACKPLLQSNLQTYNKDKTPDVETNNSPVCQDCVEFFTHLHCLLFKTHNDLRSRCYYLHFVDEQTELLNVTEHLAWSQSPRSSSYVRPESNPPT